MNLFKHLHPSLQEGAVGRLLLLLCLIVAGVQSAQAQSVYEVEWVNKHADVETVSVGGITYEVCHEYWKKGYVNYRGLGGYQEYGISADDYWIYPFGTFQQVDRYYASVVGITGSGTITIPESINNGGVDYPVRYVGLHTEQTLSTVDETYTVSEGNINLQVTTTKKYYDCIKSNVSVTASNATKLTVNADIEFKGNLAATRCTSVVFNKEVTFSANVICPAATEIAFNDYATINESATLSCNNVSTLKFNGIVHEGKIQCNSLTDIYYQSNLPEYSRSFSNYFTNATASNITAHVANKTQAECTTIHDSWAVYCDFAEVVPYTVTNPKYTVQVKIENACVQITYTNNGNTYTSTCNTTRNITVDGSSDVVIRPYKTYNDLGLVSVTLNGAEIIGNLTGSGTMYDAYTISDITSDVYLAFTGEELVNVTLKVEASAPQSHFITNNFWIYPNYGEYDNLYANQSATYTLNKYSNFFFEMESEEDQTWGITWRPAAIYVNGEDRTEEIEYDMTTYFQLERITGDTEIRVVFEPDCDFVRVMSLGPDLFWTSYDGGIQLIDCTEGDNYYVPVAKNGNGVIVRTDLINQDPADFDVIYWNNNGRYSLGQASMDRGGVELTADGKNFQFKLLPNVKDQDRIIGVYPKAPAEPEGFLQTVMRSGGGESQVLFLYELGCNEPSEIINDGDCKKIYIPPYGSDCETYFDIEISLKDGETFNVYRNGEKVTDLFAEGTYSADTKTTLHYLRKTTEFREVAKWSIIVEVEVTEWTVVKTAEVEDAEVRVSIEGGEEETTTLTDACTEIDVSNAEYAQLRVKGSIPSTTYDLYLNAYDQKLAVVKAVKEMTGLGLGEAKDLVESTLPVKVMGFATRAAAEEAKATLEAIAGTQCSIKDPSGAGSFVKVLRDGVDVTTDMTPDGDYLMMTVDAADLTRTTWVITTEEVINRFDTNDDGTVDISDVTKLVNEILGQ